MKQSIGLVALVVREYEELRSPGAEARQESIRSGDGRAAPHEDAVHVDEVAFHSFTHCALIIGDDRLSLQGV